MFWKLTSLSAASPVETVLDKEDFTLEELLDEGEIIQECKALNTRLVNFLRDSAQVEQLLRYIVEEPPADAENKQTFKFPFIACEVFTCEIDVILKTLVEEELMNLLFSFLEPNRTHSALLAGYFSKVVVCLMIRKTVPLMSYVQGSTCKRLSNNLRKREYAHSVRWDRLSNNLDKYFDLGGTSCRSLFRIA